MIMGLNANSSQRGMLRRWSLSIGDHMKKEHGIEYDIETIGNSIKKKTRQMRLFV